METASLKMLMTVITGPILYIRAGFNSINWMNTLTNRTKIPIWQKNFKNSSIVKKIQFNWMNSLANITNITTQEKNFLKTLQL
jgi:serine kinase of HPr protein (carbohydrate metabolism regulator)